MTSVRELFYTVVKYYCVQPPTVGGALVTPKHFFELWIPFLQQFKQSWEKEQKLLARKRWRLKYDSCCDKFYYHGTVPELRKCRVLKWLLLNWDHSVALDWLVYYVRDYAWYCYSFSFTESKTSEQNAEVIIVFWLYISLLLGHNDHKSMIVLSPQKVYLSRTTYIQNVDKLFSSHAC